MATIKSFTSLEQSKRLAKILNHESADMYYQYVLPKSGKIMHNPKIGNPVNALEWYNKGYTTSGKEPITFDEYCVPCWSLAALLSVVSEEVSLNSFKDGNWNAMVQQNGKMIYGDANNSVDACVEMIEKLHEQNLL